MWSSNRKQSWYEYCDRFYKVGERNAAGSFEFPVREARIYSYTDPDLK